MCISKIHTIMYKIILTNIILICTVRIMDVNPHSQFDKIYAPNCIVTIYICISQLNDSSNIYNNRSILNEHILHV